MQSFLSFLFILSSVLVFSQDVTVINNSTKKAITGVAVYNTSKTTSSITDLYGGANLDKFTADETIYFKHIAYRTLSTNKSDIFKNGNKVFLRPNTQNLSEIVVSASKFSQIKKRYPKKS